MSKVSTVMGVTITLLSVVAEAQTLRLSTQVNAPHPWLDAAETFKNEVEMATDGRINVRVFGGGSLGRDATVLDEMRLGTIDVLIGGTQEATPFFPEFQLFSLNYLFPDEEAFRAAMQSDGEVLSYFQETYETSDSGLVLLALTGGGVRNLSNTGAPVSMAEDLRGMKMRVPGSRMDARMWAAMGAQPISLPFTELYTGLQTGVADAFESTVSGYVGGKLYEAAPYHTQTQHQFMVSHITMSDYSFSHLSDEDQKVVRDAAATAALVAIDKGFEYDLSLLEPLIKSGAVTLTTIDTAPLIQSMRPLHDDAAAEFGATEILESIRAIN